MRFLHHGISKQKSLTEFHLSCMHISKAEENLTLKCGECRLQWNLVEYVLLYMYIKVIRNVFYNFVI